MSEAGSLRNIRALLVDLDGVVYRGEQVLSGAREFFSLLRQTQLRHVFLTNNSTRTPDQVAAKLSRMGIDATKDDVITSADATAEYLATTIDREERLLILGGQGLREALSDWRISTRQPDCVVVGLDVHLTYQKLARAAIAIRAGARFVASNADATLPTECGELPGAGALVAALQIATGTKPMIIGKPQPLMLELALRRLRVPPTQAAIVGDRIETDVAAGHNSNLCSILVLTGVTGRVDLPSANPRPNHVFEDLSELYHALGTVGALSASEVSYNT